MTTLRIATATLGATLVLALLASCSSGPTKRAAAPSPPPSASPAQPLTPAAAPSPTPSAPGTLNIGASCTLPNGGTATVYAYQQPVAASASRPSQAGYTWGAVDVKVCATTDPNMNITVTNIPWSLVYGDDSRAEPSNISYNQFPKPAYAWGDTALAPGRCLRGWIVFPVPANKRPTMVEYQLNNDERVLVDWVVK